jgi:hypothetical protein
MSRKKLPDKFFAWTPNLAYAVGLIVTDGCLSPDGRHLMLTSKDIDQLETFKSCLGRYTQISIAGNKEILCHRVQFSDIQFYNWLLKIGLTPNKSRTIGEIDIPDAYFLDFLRGHLDGDGTITIYTDRYNTFKSEKYVYDRISIRFISAGKTHIEWLQAKIIKNIGVIGKIHRVEPRKENYAPLYVLKFGKKESLKILSKIYYSDTIPALRRKRDQYESFVKKTNK